MRAISLLVLATVVAVCVANLQLELVSLISRHGDRTPLVHYPNDPNINSFPQGLGQLTIRGMQQHFLLGKLLRRLYVDSGFLDENYSRTQFVMRSVDLDYILTSAESQLAALFFPTPAQQFDQTILWQPVPVHTVPINEDFLLLGPHVSCPKMLQLMNETSQTMEFKIMLQENEALFKALSGYTGENVTYLNVGLLYDTLSVEYTHNLTMPSWFNTALLEKMRRVHDQVLNFLYNSDEKKRITGGLWANTVINNMMAKANGSLPDRKMFIYSAHDVIEAAAMNVFNMYNGVNPPIASAFIIELYRDTISNNHSVRFLYRNATYSNDTVELTLPGCDQPCPLDDVKRITAPYLTTLEQVKKECTS